MLCLMIDAGAFASQAAFCMATKSRPLEGGNACPFLEPPSLTGVGGVDCVEGRLCGGSKTTIWARIFDKMTSVFTLLTDI